MRIRTYANRSSLSRAAAADAARAIEAAIAERGDARLVAATGASQIEFLHALTSAPGIDWQRVEMFHLDEYVGLPLAHPASFRRYLLDRLIGPAGIARYHLLDGEEDPERAAAEAGARLAERDPDVAFVGIGENGHLAFNDPPADFETVGEGWFPSFSDVPARAITMSIRQILKARQIIAVVPDARKAPAVQACLTGPLSEMAPASILRMHADTTVYLDSDSASRLPPAVRGAALEADA